MNGKRKGKRNTEPNPSGFRFPVDPNELPQINYTRASDCKVVYCEGGITSVTPSGLVGVALYSEYIDQAEGAVLDVDEENRIVERVEGGPPSIIREVQVELLMRPDSASKLQLWLDKCVRFIEENSK